MRTALAPAPVACRRRYGALEMAVEEAAAASAGARRCRHGRTAADRKTNQKRPRPLPRHGNRCTIPALRSKAL